MEGIKIIKTDTQNPAMQGLIRLLDKELRGEYNDFQDVYSTMNDVSAGIPAVLLELDGEPIGCGAFKPHDKQSGELKRIFVHPDHRGKGFSKKIVNALEEWIITDGFSNAILETGTKQIAALGLYKKFGYQVIENYEPYKGIPTSICMKKVLVKK